MSKESIQKFDLVNVTLVSEHDQIQVHKDWTSGVLPGPVREVRVTGNQHRVNSRKKYSSDNQQFEMSQEDIDSLMKMENYLILKRFQKMMMTMQKYQESMMNIVGQRMNQQDIVLKERRKCSLKLSRV